MGVKFSSCLVDNCGKEDELFDYSSAMVDATDGTGDSSLLSLNKESLDKFSIFKETSLNKSLMTDYSDENDVVNEKTTEPIKIATGNLQSSQEIESPRSSCSNQSVLSIISPTKDKSSKNKRMRVVSPVETPSSAPFQVVDKLQGSGGLPQNTDSIVLEEIRSFIVAGDTLQLAELLSQHQDVDISQVLLESLQYSPLHLAVIHDQLAMAQFLLERGVDINIRDKDGQTAIYLAYTLGRFELTNLLVAHKAQEFCASPFSPYARSAATPSVQAMSTDEFDNNVILAARECSFRSFRSSDYFQRTLSNASLLSTTGSAKHTGFSKPDTPLGVSHIRLSRSDSTIEFARFDSFHYLEELSAQQQLLNTRVPQSQSQSSQSAAAHHAGGMSIAITSPFEQDGEDEVTSTTIASEQLSSSDASSTLLRGEKKPLGKRLRKAAGKAISFMIPKPSAAKGYNNL